MPTNSRTAEFTILHSIRIKGRVQKQDLFVESSYVARADLEQAVGRLIRKGFVSERNSDLSELQLTPSGRGFHLELLDEERRAKGYIEALEEVYRSFLLVNQEVLQTITSWQLRAMNSKSPVINDHSDSSYDRRVLARLTAIDGRAQGVCRELSRVLPRLVIYANRLSSARGRIANGDVQWMDNPRLDSYHNVWFQLHQDLICTLGRDRES